MLKCFIKYYEPILSVLCVFELLKKQKRPRSNNFTTDLPRNMRCDEKKVAIVLQRVIHQKVVDDLLAYVCYGLVVSQSSFFFSFKKRIHVLGIILFDQCIYCLPQYLFYLYHLLFLYSLS